MKKPALDEGPDPIDRHVGSRNRGRRIGLRTSQTKLGQSIGVTFQQIQKYESGTNRVGASNLYKIAQALGVDVSFFFEGLPADSTAEPAPAGIGLSDQPGLALEANQMNSREAFELMHNFFRVPDPMIRKRLFQLIRILAFSEHDSPEETEEVA